MEPKTRSRQMAPRIQKLVNSCGECPHYSYYSGGVHTCSLVDQFVRDKSVIAPFCPLAVYPSQAISDMMALIDAYKGKAQKDHVIALFACICSKFSFQMTERFSIRLRIKDLESKEEETVHIDISNVTEFLLREGKITFVDMDKTFTLLIGGDRPELRRLVKVDDGLPERYITVQILA